MSVKKDFRIKFVQFTLFFHSGRDLYDAYGARLHAGVSRLMNREISKKNGRFGKKMYLNFGGGLLLLDDD